MIFAVFFLSTIGCFARDSDDSAVLSNGDFDKGEALFLSYCASCHGEDAAGARGPNLLQGRPLEMSTEENKVEIQSRMRREGLGNVLSDQDITDIIAFLYVLQGR